MRVARIETMLKIPAETVPDAPNALRGLRSSRRTLWLASLSGLLLVGAFPHLDWGWLAWVALVPFLLTFPHASLRGALAHGAAFGLVFFGGLFYWIGLFAAHAVGPPLGMVTWAGVMLSQAATCVVFAAGAWGLRRCVGSGWGWRLGVPALWTVLEWARQFGTLGTAWGDVAFTQHHALVLLQTTKLTGTWGLTFGIVLTNVCLADAIQARQWRPLLLPALLLGAALVYGTVTLRTERLHPGFVAAALQGNINQNVPLTPEYTQRVMATFRRQGREAAARGAVLTVWPETALPGYLRSTLALSLPLMQDARTLHQAMLVGGREFVSVQGKDANALTLITAQGRIASSYAKQRLVPFGEYVPGRAQFPVLDKLHLSVYDMAPGAAHQPLLDAGPPVGKVGAAICYDSTYGELMRDETARGANLLVVTTDDTWFGRTAAASQHAAMAAVDAAETDRYLVRCAATGVSQVIDPTGRVIAQAPLFTQRVVAAPVEARRTQTFYVRFSDWFIWLCGLGLVGIATSARVRRGQTSRNSAR